MIVFNHRSTMQTTTSLVPEHSENMAQLPLAGSIHQPRAKQKAMSAAGTATCATVCFKRKTPRQSWCKPAVQADVSSLTFGQKLHRCWCCSMTGPQVSGKGEGWRSNGANEQASSGLPFCRPRRLRSGRDPSSGGTHRAPRSAPA